MLTNKTVFSDSHQNELRVSSCLQADHAVNFKQLSVKYVVTGQEKYTVNNKKIQLNRGEYIIGNKNTSSDVFIDTDSVTNGICIDVSKNLIQDVINCRYEDNSAFSNFLFEQDWMIQKYNTKNSTLGYSISQIALEFENLKNGQTHVSHELFFSIAECVVNDQSQVFNSFSRLTSKKEETNGRLFNYVHDAKNYIDAHFLENLNILDIAREAKLSEYHFIRLFKTIFNNSPYRYLLNKRLEFAIELIQNEYSLTDISDVLGFTDVPAFSKAFKKFHGCNPSSFKSN